MGEAIGRCEDDNRDQFAEDDGEPGLSVVDPVLSENAAEFAPDEEEDQPANYDNEFSEQTPTGAVPFALGGEEEAERG
jgi:hypothetical protein